jgi:hypothetical protein
MYLLIDSTGLRLCGAGEWLTEKHAAKTRRSWRKLHIGLDADTGQIVAAMLTTEDVNDGAEVDILLNPVAGAVASPEAVIIDRHLRFIAKHGRREWQQVSGYTKRARVEAAVARWKQVISDGLRSRTDKRGRPRWTSPSMF